MASPVAMLDLSVQSLAVVGLLFLLPLVLLFPGSTSRSSTIRRLIHFLHKETPLATSEIVSLRIYPIKSCRGIEISKTTLRTTGLEFDRQWVLVDAETHQFITIRQNPEMTLINTAISDDGTTLIVSISKNSTSSTTTAHKDLTDKAVRIPTRPSSDWLAEHTTYATDIEIWSHTTDGYCYGPEVNELFSSFLDRRVTLVYKGPSPRILAGNGAPSLLGRVQTTKFADVHPVLIATQASIAELNARIHQNETVTGKDSEKREPNDISIERFRPNIIVKGDKPWSEDRWKRVRIVLLPPTTSKPASSAQQQKKKTKKQYLEFDIVARCARCQVPNVDPDTAVKDPSQPWDTLMSYRRVDEGIKFKPCFGMLSAPKDEGEIEVGMRFEVLEETDQHRYIAGM